MVAGLESYYWNPLFSERVGLENGRKGHLGLESVLHVNGVLYSVCSLFKPP